MIEIIAAVKTDNAFFPEAHIMGIIHAVTENQDLSPDQRDILKSCYDNLIKAVEGGDVLQAVTEAYNLGVWVTDNPAVNKIVKKISMVEPRADRWPHSAQIQVEVDALARPIILKHPNNPKYSDWRIAGDIMDELNKRCAAFGHPLSRPAIAARVKIVRAALLIKE
jgi:hypothetical protein